MSAVDPPIRENSLTIPVGCGAVVEVLSSMDAPLIASVFRSDGQLGLQSSIRPR